MSLSSGAQSNEQRDLWRREIFATNVSCVHHNGQSTAVLGEQDDAVWVDWYRTPLLVDAVIDAPPLIAGIYQSSASQVFESHVLPSAPKPLKLVCGHHGVARTSCTYHRRWQESRCT